MTNLNFQGKLLGPCQQRLREWILVHLGDAWLSPSGGCTSGLVTLQDPCGQDTFGCYHSRRKGIPCPCADHQTSWIQCGASGTWTSIRFLCCHSIKALPPTIRTSLISVPQFWSCCLQSKGAGGRRPHWTGLRETDAATSGSPPATPDPSSRTPYRTYTQTELLMALPCVQVGSSATLITILQWRERDMNRKENFKYQQGQKKSFHKWTLTFSLFFLFMSVCCSDGKMVMWYSFSLLPRPHCCYRWHVQFRSLMDTLWSLTNMLIYICFSVLWSVLFLMLRQLHGPLEIIFS